MVHKTRFVDSIFITGWICPDRSNNSSFKTMLPLSLTEGVAGLGGVFPEATKATINYVIYLIIIRNSSDKEKTKKSITIFPQEQCDELMVITRANQDITQIHHSLNRARVGEPCHF